MYHPDRLDSGILRELQNPASRWNIRKSFFRIAKRLMVDEETIRRRVDKMEELGIIQGWTVIPNPHLLQRDRAGVYVQLPFGSVNREFLEKLASLQGVVSVQSFHGESLLIFLDYPTDRLNAEVAVIEEICGAGGAMVLESKFPPFGLAMTATDWLILRALRGGARRSLGDLAREARISAKTFNRRLERLTEGHAFYLETKMDFQRMAGLAYTLVIRYGDRDSKEKADGYILEKLGETYEWSDTRSDPDHSIFSAFSSNLGEAERIHQWVRALKGISDVKLGLVEDRLSVGSWIDDEIQSRSKSAPTAKQLVAFARWVPPRPAPVEVSGVRRAIDSWWTGSLVEGKNVRVRIDPDICMGAASCVAMAPKVFRLDWARRRSSMTEGAPLEVLRTKGTEPEALFLAAQGCPYGVIQIEDADTGEPLYP